MVANLANLASAHVYGAPGFGEDDLAAAGWQTEKQVTAGLSVRPRRMRLTPSLRRMARETELSPDDFVYPLFVRYGDDQQVPIDSMPGCSQLTVDKLAAEAREIAALGIPGSDSLRHPGA